MSTNMYMPGFKMVHKNVWILVLLDESSLSIGRVKHGLTINLIFQLRSLVWNYINAKRWILKGYNTFSLLSLYQFRNIPH